MSDSSEEYTDSVEDGTPGRACCSENEANAVSDFPYSGSQLPVTRMTDPPPPPTCQSRRLLSTSAPGIEYFDSATSLTANHQLRAAILNREQEHKQFGTCPCTSFGLDRETRYPHYYFCHNCTLWDNEAQANNLNAISSISRNFRCRAEHQAGMYFSTQAQKSHYTLCKTTRLQPNESLPSVMENCKSTFSYSDHNSSEEDDDASSNKSIQLLSSERASTSNFDRTTDNTTMNSRKHKLGQDNISTEATDISDNHGCFFLASLQDHLDDLNYMKERVAQLE